MTNVKSIFLSLMLALPGSAVAAKPHLSEISIVTEGLIATGIAYEISEKCDAIRPRYIRGLSYLSSLKGYARSLGYSNDEIKAYTDDRQEEVRLVKIARARLESLGAIDGNEQSYCKVGKAQIAQKTAIGRLLR